MDTKWIEDAFKEANPIPDKDKFLERLPAILMAFLMSAGPEALAQVTRAMKDNEPLMLFVSVVFGCGMLEAQRDREVHNK